MRLAAFLQGGAQLPSFCEQTRRRPLMSIVNNMLIPTDFSEASDVALRYGVHMAQVFEARLFFLHVPRDAKDAALSIADFEAMQRERLSLVLPAEGLDRLRPEYAVRIGSPANEIVRYADARDIDLIVMGTHGRSGVMNLLMGSVAEDVVRRALCPVLLVRHPMKPVKVPATAPIVLAEA
jgi:nucleotide-binding universal stress UspA family protein